MTDDANAPEETTEDEAPKARKRYIYPSPSWLRGRLGGQITVRNARLGTAVTMTFDRSIRENEKGEAVCQLHPFICNLFDEDVEAYTARGLVVSDKKPSAKALAEIAAEASGYSSVSKSEGLEEVEAGHGTAVASKTAESGFQPGPSMSGEHGHTPEGADD